MKTPHIGVAHWCTECAPDKCGKPDARKVGESAWMQTDNMGLKGTISGSSGG